MYATAIQRAFAGMTLFNIGFWKVAHERKSRNKWWQGRRAFKGRKSIDLITDKVQPMCLAKMNEFPKDFWRVALPKGIMWVCNHKGFDPRSMCSSRIRVLEGCDNAEA